jgi:eukaryotic-like serine/threonine-protein kinase
VLNGVDNYMEIDKYLVQEEIGSGNYGVVYRVLDRALNVEKAIKVLKDSPTQNFMEQLEEARILYICRHKNIVSVNEANIFRIENKPRVVIDMELIRGTSLEKYMEENYT